eukprot:s4991_g6.t1
MLNITSTDCIDVGRYLPHSYRFALPACPSRKSTPHVAIGAARFLVATEENRILSTNVCDVKVQPPLCRVPLSVSSERAAWEFVKKQTLARVAQHVGTISEDPQVHQQEQLQHQPAPDAWEERMVLRSWCNVVVRIAAFLNTLQAEESMATIKLPDDQVLENDEPRQRPRYWERLLADRDPGHVEAEKPLFPDDQPAISEYEYMRNPPNVHEPVVMVGFLYQHTFAAKMSQDFRVLAAAAAARWVLGRSI